MWAHFFGASITKEESQKNNLSLSGSGNVIEGNFIGTDVTGTKALANVGDGVGTEGSAAGVTIGGTGAGAGNVIAGNTGNGVDVGDIDTLVEGNFPGQFC
jgi:hypothetical protein